MKQDIRLYLAGERADLATDPKILFNYKVTDTENPTAVKNNFSKTITLEGTDNNNALFGAIYDLGRIQTYGAGNFAGTDFNPLRKADFELYIDSELYETGYFKLTEISKTNTKINYTIQLFGGLGEFIYNLSESEGGNKLEFKDLTIIKDHRDPVPVEGLNFTISKETVFDAWQNIDSYSSPYSTLNFAPCYNGIPDNFDADKVLVNLNGRNGTMGNLTGLTSINGWALGECSRELTEWEARDIRASLQRPVLRVRDLIESCCYEENNGGYKVNLDSKWFSHDNPYYERAFITLPQISDMLGTEESETSEEITGATITRGSQWDTARYYDINTSANFSEFTNLELDLDVNFTADNGSTASILYTCHKADINTNFTLSSSYIKEFKYYSAVLIQLVAYDELDKVVATSAAYQLISPINGSAPADFKDKMDGKAVNIPEWKTLYGYFKKNGSVYKWCDMHGNETKLRFNFPSSTAFYRLRLRVQRPYMQEWKYTTIFGGHTKTSANRGASYMWPTTVRKVNGNHNLNYYLSYGVITSQQFDISYFKARATRYGGFLTGKEISRDKILTLGITPADFLLSYIKLFGLHIWKDPIEKTIYIADRSVFYDLSEIVDINKYIDRSKEIKITPQVAKSKWYDFNTEQHDSEANEQYRDEYGMDFGLQRVNTSYDFDAANTEVYNGEFKGGVQVLESSPYYYADYDLWPVFVYNGFKITTFASTSQGLEGTEHTVNTQTGVNIYPINAEYQGFDLFDKPQFHGKGNDATEGNLTLLFYDTMKPTTASTAGGINYFLTDEIEAMVSRNSKTPCYILTDTEYDAGGSRIGIRLDMIPRFSRYIIYDENKYITHSWDFGRTLETYIPGTTLTEGSSIYERCWKDYIADMYDVNSRVLTCRCLLKGQVNPEWLRRFYYFDNAIWRLNQIKEWNPGSYDTTMCEFLKVNDLNAYEVARITYDPITDFYLPGRIETSEESTQWTQKRYYTIGNTVTSVTANIEVQDGGLWYFGDGPGAEYQIAYENGTYEYEQYSTITGGIDRGYGNTQVQFNIGANTSDEARTFRFNIVIYGASGDYWYYIYLRQEAQDVGSIIATRFAGSGNVPGAGGTVLLTVTSSSNWTATTDYSYTTLDTYNGRSGNTTVQLTFTENDSASPRYGRVRFSNSGGASYIYNISQNGYGIISDLNFNADSYTFEDPNGGTINGTVECPTGRTWSVSSIPSWLSMAPTTGEPGTTAVQITAEPNMDSEARFGAITVAGGGQTSTINFGQRANDAEGIRIHLATDSPSAVGGSISGQIYSSVDGWHFEYSNWLQPSILSGSAGYTNFTLNIAANSTGYGRVGYIRAQGGGYSDEISITQDAS